MRHAAFIQTITLPSPQTVHFCTIQRHFCPILFYYCTPDHTACILAIYTAVQMPSEQMPKHNLIQLCCYTFPLQMTTIYLDVIGCYIKTENECFAFGNGENIFSVVERVNDKFNSATPRCRGNSLLQLNKLFSPSALINIHNICTIFSYKCFT